MSEKKVQKPIHKLKIGDVVELQYVNEEWFYGTIKKIDLADQSIVVEESVFNYYQKTYTVIEDTSPRLEGH